MSTTLAARASRQTVILTAIAGLHLGAFVLVTSELNIWVVKTPEPPPPITVYLPKEKPVQVPRPENPAPFEVYFGPEPIPELSIPKFDEQPNLPLPNDNLRLPDVGSGVEVPSVDDRPPALRTRNNRLAAAIDACYPAAARRVGEEGRVIAKIMIDAGGMATAWSVAQSSGFARLDAALDCVIRRLEFAPGRRDGSAVAAEAMLPIVFRLN